MQVEVLDYEKLTPEEQEEWSYHKHSYFIRINWGTDTDLFCDGMEPEDSLFVRDLSWIVPALKRAYVRGKLDANVN